MNNMKEIVENLIKKEKLLIYTDIFFFCILTLIIAGFPFLQKQLIDYVQYSQITKTGIIQVGLEYAGLVIMYFIFNYFGTLNEFRIYALFKKKFRDEISTYFFNQRYLDGINTSKAISILTSEVDRITDEYLSPIIDLLENILGVIIYFFFIFLFISKYAALILLILSCIPYVLSNITTKKIGIKRKEYQKDERQYLNTINSFFQNMSIILPINIKNIQSFHNSVTHTVYDSNMNFGKTKAIGLSVNHSINYFVSFITFVIMLICLYFGLENLGSLIATIGYVDIFLDATGRVVDDKVMIDSFNKKGFMDDDIIVEIDETRTIVEEKINNISIHELKLDVKNKSLTYFDLKFDRSNTYFVKGENGIGKSTLLKCICGIQKMYDGSIEMNNIDNRNKYFSDVYYLDQENKIFSSSFIENVSMYNAYSLENLKKFDFYNKLTDVILEKQDCTKLSGGEQQIVALCRAIASGATTLLIDEAFSALDVQKRLSIINELKNKNYFLIYVSHNIKDKEMFDVEIEVANEKR
jgi:ABC-type bacteriocin/lantibiotic exporter with double-glycine peptidase domain